jgi:hypothetical protein
VVVAAEVDELRDELLVVVVVVDKARYVAWPWYSAFEYAVTPPSSSTVKLDAVASEPDEENPVEGLAVARREKTADASEALLDEEADAFEEENAGDEGVYVPGRRVICRVDPLTGEETTTPACERVRGAASAPTGTNEWDAPARAFCPSRQRSGEHTADELELAVAVVAQGNVAAATATASASIVAQRERARPRYLAS